MAFVTVDTDAIGNALERLALRVAEVEQQRQDHVWRSERTQEAMHDLRQRNWSGFALDLIEDAWNSLPLSSLGSEFRSASSGMAGIGRDVKQAFEDLASAHPGVLAEPIRDLGLEPETMLR